MNKFVVSQRKDEDYAKKITFKQMHMVEKPNNEGRSDSLSEASNAKELENLWKKMSLSLNA